ncbi:MAG: hypothetical protein U0Q11_00700 [Vicinamibacterales bacterium]
MITRVLPLACVLLLHLVPSALGQTITPPEGYPAPGQPTRLVLLSNGTEPRRLLRYSVPPDYKAHMNMDLKMQLAMSVGDMRMPAPAMPAMHFGVDLTARPVSDDGDMEVSLTYTGVNVDAPGAISAQQLAAINDDLRAVRGTFTVSNRGFYRDVRIDTSSVSDPQLRQSMDSMVNNLGASVLPEEPVGVGSRWELRMAMAANGLTMFQKMTVEAVAVDATSLTTRLTIEQTAPAQDFAMPQASSGAPALPPGMHATAESISGSGEGRAVIPFNGLVPTSDVSARSTMIMRVSAPNLGEQRMGIENTVNVQVSPGK